MNSRSNKASLRNLAKLAGVSHAAASYALQNQPGVSPETRERILRIAKELGYTPDARLSNWMTRVRDAKSKDLLPIAWLNTSEEKNAWKLYKFHTPFIEGARKRAEEMGYRLEEIWCRERGMTMHRLSKMLYQRGIEGVIVALPARHMRLDWTHMASVALGDSLLAPRLHRVTGDVNYNLQLALKNLKRIGYRRIGICLAHAVDTASHASAWDTARSLYYSAPEEDRVPPLFHRLWAKDGGSSEDKEKEMIAWLKKYRPQVVIGHDNRHEEWARKAGLRVPEDLGLVHLAVDDDVLEWSGIHSQRSEMGKTAVEWLASLIRNRQFGVPGTPLNILIRGVWHEGRTLLQPSKRAEGTTGKRKSILAMAR